MSQGPNSRYVPSGVNAQSWLGFEQRIQQRRFQALLDAMHHAIDAGDAVQARIALEEARELRPDAPELAEVEERLAAIPILDAPNAAAAFLRSRAVGAVMLLLLGIVLMTGIEWIRSSETAAAGPTPVGGTNDLDRAAPVPALPPPEGAPPAIVPPPAAAPVAAAQMIGTSGGDPAIVPSQPAGDARRSTEPGPAPSFGAVPPLKTPAQPPFGAVPPVKAPPPITGEIPDDYVYVPPARMGARRPSAAKGVAGIPKAPSADTGLVATTTTPSPVAPPSSGTPFVGGRADITSDQTRVAAVLYEYARAYGRLDAGAARQVWPTVNERALARAFAGLESQDVEFDDCEINVRGATANASCRGKARYVGKVGSGEERTEPRTWRFELRRDGEAWKIENAEARRQ